MISTAMLFIANELDQYLRKFGGLPLGSEVVLNNVALLETEDNEDLKDNIVITLVNIEEESTLKNTSPYQRRADGRINLIQPPVWLNLYLLFSCNFPKKYADALFLLGWIIRFFQSIPALDGSAPLSGIPNDLTDEQEEELTETKLTFELYTLTFEQINHLWGPTASRPRPGTSTPFSQETRSTGSSSRPGLT